MYWLQLKKCLAILSSIVGVAFLILGLASCSKERQDMSEPVFKAEIEKRVGLKFPSNAVWIGNKLDRGMDYFFVGCFRAPKEEIDKMLAPVDITWSDTKRIVRNIKGVSWFTPEDANAFRSFETHYPNPHSVLKLLIDETASQDKGQVVVFLNWYELD